MNQLMPPNYAQYPNQMPMNYPQTAGFSGGAYPPSQMQEEKAGAQAPSPKDPRLFFSDSQFAGENSSGNIPQTQIDPSPTAEKLLPGFITEESAQEERSKYGKKSL